MTDDSQLPKFFRVRQSFPRPKLADIPSSVHHELEGVLGSKKPSLTGKTIAITVGSRGIANIARITRACVDFFADAGAHPFIVPAMGSHGGGTAEGQTQVLESFGVTEPAMGCPVRSSMDIEQVCTSEQGFPVYIDKLAAEADGILVVNRIKPHTRFAGDIESGLMKMMLIGLGKFVGAEIYHRAIQNFSFDQIVRSVASQVIQRCNVLGGLAIMENAYEETAQVRCLAAEEIEASEPHLLQQVKQWMPQLPFEKFELLIVDQIGKNISGTGMDTNVVGRKKNDHAAIAGDRPDIHHIYVRSLTKSTHGNAAGVGLAELCHQRVLSEMDAAKTEVNCITAGHIIGAMRPVGFASDQAAITTACRLAGIISPAEVTAVWIKDTLHLDELECSEALWNTAQKLDLDILSAPSTLNFDKEGDLIERFPLDADSIR